MILDISEVARRSGLPASTLRYYEDQGLIQSIGRHGLRRTFDQAVLVRLSIILLGRFAGFSLKEIADMFSHDGRLQMDRARISSKAEELDQQIRRMRALRDILRHTAECPAPNHMSCPTFQRMLKLAGGRAHKRRSLSNVP